MKYIKHILLIVSIFLIGQKEFLYSKVEPLELIQAGTLNYITKNDSSYIHLIDNVEFQKGTIKIFCEQAFHYEDKSLLILKKDVTIIDDESVFQSEEVRYNTKTDEIHIPGQNRIQMEERRLDSHILRADLDKNIYTAWGEVEIQDSTSLIHSDSLIYYNDDEIALLFENASITDTVEHISFLGDFIRYKMKDKILLSDKNPSVIQMDSLNVQQFKITGDIIQGFQNDNSFLSTGNVEITQDSLFASCDSFYYSGEEEVGSLLVEPRIEYEENVLTGKAIYLTFNNNEIQQMDIDGEALMTTLNFGYFEADTTDSLISKLSTLSGLYLSIFSENNKIKNLEMKGMASSDYYVFEDSIYQGLNTSSGDTVKMNFDGGELEEIFIIAGAEGTYYPDEDVMDMDTTITYRSNKIKYILDDKLTILEKEANLIYGELSLFADTVKINWNENLLYALPEITDTGLAHLPEMHQKGDNPFIGEKLIYNLKTRKGKIVQGRTKLDDGYYSGEKILNQDTKSFYVRDGKYSTCEDPHPHFWIESKKMKLIPNDKVFARPLVLKIAGIPVFALPYGFFPSKSGGRHSGWLMPTYGFRTASGRFLKDGGFYWAPSDYFDTQLVVNFYDKWGFLTSSSTNYALRYKLTGKISMSYQNFFIDQNITSYDIKLNHNQTLGKNSRLSISGSYTNNRSFYQQTGTTLNERLNQKLISNATYSTKFGPFGFSSNLSRTEDLITGNVSATLPNISLSKSSAPLFKKKSASAEQKWYHNITYNINSRFTNKYTSTLQSDSTYEKFYDNYLKNTSSLNASHKFFGWLSMSPRVNFTDGWIFNYDSPVIVNDSVAVDSSGAVMIEEINDFKRRDTYNLSLSGSTKLYGIFPVNILNLAAIRHVMSPSLSFKYTPDFSENENYVFRGVDELGNEIDFDYFSGSLLGSTSSRESKSLSFSLGNQFAAKIKKGLDKYKKYDFLTLNLSGNYNFTADSLNLSPLNVSYRASKLPGNLRFNGSLKFDPYVYNTSIGKRVNEFYSLPRMTYFSFDTGFQFKDPGSKGKKDSLRTSSSGFSKWSANIGLRFNYSASNPENEDKNVTATGNFSANLTENWRVTYRINFDIAEQKLTYQHITLHRDLHCWELNFDWTPSGIGQSYFLKIQVKAPTLKDLKYEKRSGRSTYY